MLGKKNFGPEKILMQKQILWVPKQFRCKKFWANKFLVKKTLGQKKFLLQKNSGKKNLKKI